MEVAIIIPARKKSTRFPNKPLAQILGKSMIERVWSQCIKALPRENVYVATDSKDINFFCSSLGINTIMTSEKCQTGTDRVNEAAKKLKQNIIINVQGDEPLISPKDIKKVIRYAIKNPNEILNAMCPIDNEEDYRSLSVPKVIFSKSNHLLYMSRASIPHNKLGTFKKAWRQVCIYSFPKNALNKFSQKKKTEFELIEDIEILRFLELGFKVKMIKVSQSSIAVDHPEDIKKVEDEITKRFSKI